MLKVKNLSFAYKKKGKSHQVFQNLNVEFKEGLNVILGPNGAGKSTLIKSIFGLLKYKGEIFYKDKSLTNMKLEEKIKFMSYLPQMDLDTSTLTVFEMVMLGRLPDLGYKMSDEDIDLVMNILDTLNIKDLAFRNFGELSGGQKKLVFIAQTLVRTPKLILMDEPVNSLDLQKQLELCQLLEKVKEKEKVDIILILHDINLACRYADHVVIIDENGQPFSSGLIQDVVTEEMLEKVYGVKAEVNYDKKGIPLVSPLCSVRAV
jgi:iron complex transport system ATP-binding protein